MLTLRIGQVCLCMSTELFLSHLLRNSARKFPGVTNLEKGGAKFKNYKLYSGQEKIRVYFLNKMKYIISHWIGKQS